MGGELATIGYEKTEIEDFMETLSVAGIKTLLDIRELPVSRRKGFSKNKLKENLERHGIEYVHLIGLGDPKEGRDAAKDGRFDDFQSIFSEHMKSARFKEHLEDALEIIKTSPACLMCYERDHKFCHRKLVADEISTILGVEVRHLGVPDGISRRGKTRRQRESLSSC